MLLATLPSSPIPCASPRISRDEQSKGRGTLGACPQEEREIREQPRRRHRTRKRGKTDQCRGKEKTTMTESQEGSNVTAQQQFDQERSEAFAGGMVKGPNSGAMARARGENAETVISKDGTPIAYRRSGEGPPLVLV